MNVAIYEDLEAPGDARPAPPTRFTLIDALRGAAAVAVLFYHYMHFFMIGTDHTRQLAFLQQQPGQSWLTGLYEYGFYAVQVFWVISGFVFAVVYLGRGATTREFVVNRFARLYPLHLLTLLVVALLQGIALRRLGHTLFYDNYDWPHFALQIGFASDWINWTDHSFNGPIWSVSVEVLIYAVFWLLRPVLERVGWPGLAAIILLCLLGNVLGAWTRVPMCGFYFFQGVALARLHERFGERIRPRLIAVLVLIALGIVGLTWGGAMPLEALGIPGLAAATILLLAGAERAAPPLLRSAGQWLGDNTYGLYLWHVPVQMAALLLLLPYYDPAKLAHSGWFLAAFLFGTTALARATFVLFERPMREFIRIHFAAPADRGVTAP
jgi:peptidoglycan/LPS O-acetylase OafA/YrhL